MVIANAASLQSNEAIEALVHARFEVAPKHDTTLCVVVESISLMLSTVHLVVVVFSPRCDLSADRAAARGVCRCCSWHRYVACNALTTFARCFQRMLTINQKIQIVDRRQRYSCASAVFELLKRTPPNHAEAESLLHILVRPFVRFVSFRFVSFVLKMLLTRHAPSISHRIAPARTHACMHGALPTTTAAGGGAGAARRARLAARRQRPAHLRRRRFDSRVLTLFIWFGFFFSFLVWLSLSLCF